MGRDESKEYWDESYWHAVKMYSAGCSGVRPGRALTYGPSPSSLWSQWRALNSPWKRKGGLVIKGKEVGRQQWRTREEKEVVTGESSGHLIVPKALHPEGKKKPQSVTLLFGGLLTFLLGNRC